MARLGDGRRRRQPDDGAEAAARREEHPGKEPVALPGGVHPRQRVRDRRRPQERLRVAGAGRPASEDVRHALRPRHVAAVRRQAEQGHHGVDRQVDQDLEPRQHPRGRIHDRPAREADRAAASGGERVRRRDDDAQLRRHLEPRHGPPDDDVSDKRAQFDRDALDHHRRRRLRHQRRVRKRDAVGREQGEGDPPGRAEGRPTTAVDRRRRQIPDGLQGRLQPLPLRLSRTAERAADIRVRVPHQTIPRSRRHFGRAVPGSIDDGQDGRSHQCIPQQHRHAHVRRRAQVRAPPRRRAHRRHAERRPAGGADRRREGQRVGREEEVGRSLRVALERHVHARRQVRFVRADARRIGTTRSEDRQDSSHADTAHRRGRVQRADAVHEQRRARRVLPLRTPFRARLPSG